MRVALALLLLCACNIYDEPCVAKQPPVGVTQCWVEVPHKTTKCVCDAGAERDR